MSLAAKGKKSVSETWDLSKNYLDYKNEDFEIRRNSEMTSIFSNPVREKRHSFDW